VKLADVYIDISARSNDLNRELDKAEKKTRGFGSVMQGVLQGVGIGLFSVATKAVGSFISFTGDAINAASDLSESINKVDVVFGNQADGILEWSKNAATALGQSQGQALEALGTFGNLFDSMGIGEESTADMSKGLVQLASDLASFNNIDPTEALEKLRSGIVGETEPLRTLGVNLSAAAVEMKALEMTGKATGKELTEQEKVAARYALIMEQTQNAQGDFARTSDGLANSQRILSAQWQDLSATVGAALLPVFAQLVTALNTLVQTVLPPLTAFIQDRIVPAMTQLGNLLGPVFGMLTGGFGALRGELDITSGRFGDTGAKIQEIMGLIQSVVGKALTAIAAFWEEHGATIMRSVNFLMDTVFEVFDMALDLVLGIVKAFFQILNGDFEGAAETIVATVERLWDGIMTVFSNQIQALWNLITEIDWGDLGRSIIEGIANGVIRFGEGLYEALRGRIQSAVERTKSWFGIHSPSERTAKEVGAPLAQGIVSGFADTMRGLGAHFQIAPLTGALATATQAAASVTNNYFAFDQMFQTAPDFGLARAASRDGVLAALRAGGR